MASSTCKVSFKKIWFIIQIKIPNASMTLFLIEEFQNIIESKHPFSIRNYVTNEQNTIWRQSKIFIKWNIIELSQTYLWTPFQNVPPYKNRRNQCRISTLKAKLYAVCEHIEAEKDRQNLLQKLNILQQQVGFHQWKKSITKKLSASITVEI